MFRMLTAALIIAASIFANTSADARPRLLRRTRSLSRRVRGSLRSVQRAANRLVQRGHADFVKRAPHAEPGASTLSLKDLHGNTSVSATVTRDAIVTRIGERWVRPGTVTVEKRHQYNSDINNYRVLLRQASPVVKLGAKQRRALAHRALRQALRSPRTALRLVGAALRGQAAGLSVERTEYYRFKAGSGAGSKQAFAEKHYLVGRDGKRIISISGETFKALLDLRQSNKTP